MPSSVFSAAGVGAAVVGVAVEAPAAVASLGPGFDVLAAALEGVAKSLAESLLSRGVAASTLVTGFSNRGVGVVR